MEGNILDHFMMVVFGHRGTSTAAGISRPPLHICRAAAPRPLESDRRARLATATTAEARATHGGDIKRARRLYDGESVTQRLSHGFGDSIETVKSCRDGDCPTLSATRSNKRTY